MSKREEDSEELESVINKLEKWNADFDELEDNLSNFRNAGASSNIDPDYQTTFLQKRIYIAKDRP